VSYTYVDDTCDSDVRGVVPSPAVACYFALHVETAFFGCSVQLAESSKAEAKSEAEAVFQSGTPAKAKKEPLQTLGGFEEGEEEEEEEEADNDV
jgi:hypothetical protein